MRLQVRRGPRVVRRRPFLVRRRAVLRRLGRPGSRRVYGASCHRRQRPARSTRADERGCHAARGLGWHRLRSGRRGRRLSRLSAAERRSDHQQGRRLAHDSQRHLPLLRASSGIRSAEQRQRPRRRGHRPERRTVGVQHARRLGRGRRRCAGRRRPWPVGVQPAVQLAIVRLLQPDARLRLPHERRGAGAGLRSRRISHAGRAGLAREPAQDLHDRLVGARLAPLAELARRRGRLLRPVSSERGDRDHLFVAGQRDVELHGLQLDAAPPVLLHVGEHGRARDRHDAASARVPGARRACDRSGPSHGDPLFERSSARRARRGPGALQPCAESRRRSAVASRVGRLDAADDVGRGGAQVGVPFSRASSRRNTSRLRRTRRTTR